jgi:hypothetical protein
MGWMTTPADRDAAYAIVKQLQLLNDSLATIAIALVKLSLGQPRVIDEGEKE